MNYLQEYKRLRAKGFDVKEAKRAAKINVAFYRAEEKGLVRFRVLPDESQYDDSYIDTWEIPDEEKTKIKKELWDKIERFSIWGILAEVHVLCKHCGADRWDTCDSVWAFVGDDWKDSGYDTDIKLAGLKAVGIEV